jgi:hypothetical protein
MLLLLLFWLNMLSILCWYYFFLNFYRFNFVIFSFNSNCMFKLRIFRLIFMLIIFRNSNNLRLYIINLIFYWLFNLLFWNLMYIFMLLWMIWLSMSNGSVVFNKDFSYNLVWIESIHTLHKLSIFEDRHFRKRMNTHRATEMMINLITINLINSDWPCRLWF